MPNKSPNSNEKKKSKYNSGSKFIDLSEKYLTFL